MKKQFSSVNSPPARGPWIPAAMLQMGPAASRQKHHYHCCCLKKSEWQSWVGKRVFKGISLCLHLFLDLSSATGRSLNAALGFGLTLYRRFYALSNQDASNRLFIGFQWYSRYQYFCTKLLRRTDGGCAWSSTVRNKPWPEDLYRPICKNDKG